MKWHRGYGPWQDADSGHRVVACRCGEQWRYTALGPDRAEGCDHREWRDGAIPHWSGEEPRLHYGEGELLPQRREWLGTYDTPDEARMRCEKDAG